MLRNGHKSRGLTLIELMITLGVAAILVTVAVPTLQDFIRDNRVASQSMQVIGLVNLARNEAVQRNSNAMCLRVVPSGSGTCPAGIGWCGIVFEREQGSSCSDPPGLDLPRLRELRNARVLPPDGVTAMRFDSQGRIHPNHAAPVIFNLVHENCRNEERRRFGINRMGRVAVDRLACDAE